MFKLTRERKKTVLLGLLSLILLITVISLYRSNQTYQSYIDSEMTGFVGEEKVGPLNKQDLAVIENFAQLNALWETSFSIPDRFDSTRSGVYRFRDSLWIERIDLAEKETAVFLNKRNLENLDDLWLERTQTQ